VAAKEGVGVGDGVGVGVGLAQALKAARISAHPKITAPCFLVFMIYLSCPFDRPHRDLIVNLLHPIYGLL
jgi:hypothetical protein